MHYNMKFGAARVQQMVPHMMGVFAELGLAYSMGGNVGNTMDSHRVIALAAEVGCAPTPG